MIPLGRQDAAQLGQLPKLHVYVDETGDRGFGKRASPFFAMAALLMPQEDEWWLQVTAGGLRAMVHSSQPQAPLKPIHWVEHFKAKHPERRLRAAKMLAQLPNAMVIYVITHKETLRQHAGIRKDGSAFYNYSTRLLLERVAYAARSWDGGPRLAIVRLGAVKHMDHSVTERYLRNVRSAPFLRPSTPWIGNGVPWEYLKWPPTWHSTERDGIQLADLHAGLLNAALSGKPGDVGCAENLLLCGHQLYRYSEFSCAPRYGVLGYGVKVIGDASFVTGRAWWPDWAGA